MPCLTLSKYGYGGWVSVTDTTYTSGSPFAVTSGVRTKLDLNADSVIETQAPVGTTASTFYNGTTKKLYGENDGDAFIYRLGLTADLTGTNQYMDVEIDIGGAIGVIVTDTYLFAKGSVAHPYSESTLVYTLGTFNANGGEIYITPSVNIDIYDMSLVIARIHKGVT